MPGLYASDPVELASHVFGMLYGGGSLVVPERAMHQVDSAVARLAGLDINTGLLGTVDRGIWTKLQPYVLDCVAIWQNARVAVVRVLGGDHSAAHVYLLRRGEQLLHSADPLSMLRSWSSAEPELR